MTNYGALIPIRLASERLPGKALKLINGKPVVCHLLDRIFRCSYIEKKNVVVCTTEDKSDDKLVEVVEAYGASVYRGSTDDLVLRLYNATKTYGFSHILQVDGDDPLAAVEYMNLTMQRLIENEKSDIVICERLPLGVAVKSFRASAIETVYGAYKTTKNDTGFMYFFTKTGLCNVEVVEPINDLHRCDEARLTLDYEEDFILFSEIFSALDTEDDIFKLEKIVNLLKARPELLKINNSLNEEYWQRTQEKANLIYQNAEGKCETISL